MSNPFEKAAEAARKTAQKAGKTIAGPPRKVAKTLKKVNPFENIRKALKS